MYYCPRCRTVITKEAQEQLFCANCGYHLPSIQLQPAPHPPYKSPGLIRPIGTPAQQKSATPADAALPDIHTPAHLLALSSNPPTPSATPSDPKTPNIQAPTSN